MILNNYLHHILLFSNSKRSDLSEAPIKTGILDGW